MSSGREKNWIKRLVTFECCNHLDVIAPDPAQTCFLSRDIDATLEKYLVAISESCVQYALLQSRGNGLWYLVNGVYA